MCKGWTNSYWKDQVLMLYPLGENLMGRGVASNPPPLYVRGLILKFYRSILSQIIELFINWIFVCQFENVYVL